MKQNKVMMRRKEENKDDMETSEISGLICLILKKSNLMALITSISKIIKMTINRKIEAAG